MPAIGIDPSLTGTAVCLIAKGKDPKVSRFASKTEGGELYQRFPRYKKIAEKVTGFCNEAEPSIIIIEGYSFGSRGRATVSIGEFGGVLRLRLLVLLGGGTPIIEVAPTVLKKWATGKGNAGKTEVVAALVKRYGCVFATDDEYDAFGLAMIGAQVIGEDVPATQAQLTIVETIRKQL